MVVLVSLNTLFKTLFDLYITQKTRNRFPGLITSTFFTFQKTEFMRNSVYFCSMVGILLITCHFPFSRTHVISDTKRSTGLSRETRA